MSWLPRIRSLASMCSIAEGDVPLLFTENETNNDRLFPGHPMPVPYVKDGINNYVVSGQQNAVNPVGPAPRCLLITGSRSLPASQRRRRYASSGRARPRPLRSPRHRPQKRECTHLWTGL